MYIPFILQSDILSLENVKVYIFIFTTNQSKTSLPMLEQVKLNTCGVLLFNWSIYLTFLSVNERSPMNERSAVMNSIRNVVRY